MAKGVDQSSRGGSGQREARGAGGGVTVAIYVPFPIAQDLPYLMAITMESGPASFSTLVRLKPVSFIH